MTVAERLVVAVCIPLRKWRKHAFASTAAIAFLHLLPEEVTRARLERDAVAILLHKLSDWPLLPGQLAAIEEELSSWAGLVVDSLPAVALLSDRQRTCNVLAALTSRWGAAIRLPHTTAMLPALGGAGKPLAFPLIMKPCEASSTKESHTMRVYYDAHQLAAAQQHTAAGYILQEYVPHGGLLYKVYVIGATITVSVRASLSLEEGSGRARKAFCFNTASMKRRRPSPDDTDRPLPSTAPPTHLMTDPHCLPKEYAMARLAPHMDLVRAFTLALQEEALAGMLVFGWDLLIGDDNSSLYVIDVNYFPGYDEVDFMPLLCASLEGLVRTSGHPDQRAARADAARRMLGASAPPKQQLPKESHPTFI